VLAIAITYSGMLGKVYAEIFESVDQRPAHALLQAGSGRLAAFCYGILPNAAAEVVSYTVPLGMRDARLGGDGLRRRRRPGPADRPVDAHVRRRRGEHAADVPGAGDPGRQLSRLLRWRLA
jgi:phosphonate transport system permease protein